MAVWRHKRIEQELKHMDVAAAETHTWDEWHSKIGECKVTLELPVGELSNEKIAGFLWGLRLRQPVNIQPILHSDRFRAQGLEGKAAIDTNVSTALLIARELPAFRCQIKVRKSA